MPSPAATGPPFARAVAVTGASGLVGRHLRPALADRRVVLLGRRPLEPAPNETWVPTDLARPVRIPHLGPGGALCHLAYSMIDGARNLDHTRHAVDAVNACPDIVHVVLISSVSVYGLAAAGRIDEATTCRPDTAYARLKLSCEELWRARLRPDCRLTVLRPSGVVAPDGPALWALARDTLRRPVRGIAKRAVQQRASVHFVAVGNVVAAIVFALDRPPERGQATFLVTDDDSPVNASYPAMQDAVREHAGRPPLPTLPFPKRLEAPLGALLGRPLGVRRTFSSDALRAAGFVPPVDLRTEVRRTVTGHLAELDRSPVRLRLAQGLRSRPR